MPQLINTFIQKFGLEQNWNNRHEDHRTNFEDLWLIQANIVLQWDMVWSACIIIMSVFVNLLK